MGDTRKELRVSTLKRSDGPSSMLCWTLTLQVWVSSIGKLTRTKTHLQYGSSLLLQLWLCSWSSWTPLLLSWQSHSQRSRKSVISLCWEKRSHWCMTTDGYSTLPQSLRETATSCGWLQTLTMSLDLNSNGISHSFARWLKRKDTTAMPTCVHPLEQQMIMCKVLDLRWKVTMNPQTGK